MVKKLGEPLSLVAFTKLHEKNVYLCLVESNTIKMNDPHVQRIIGNERERAVAEWYSFNRQFGREPDNAYCFDCIERFRKEQLPLLQGKTHTLGIVYFVDTFLDTVRNHSLLKRSKFLEIDLNFIVSSEKYYAEKYFEEHSEHDLGYEDLDIRTSQKAQIKGWNELLVAFEQRYESLYSAYEQGRLGA